MIKWSVCCQPVVRTDAGWKCRYYYQREDGQSLQASAHLPSSLSFACHVRPALFPFIWQCMAGGNTWLLPFHGQHMVLLGTAWCASEGVPIVGLRAGQAKVSAIPQISE